MIIEPQGNLSEAGRGAFAEWRKTIVGRRAHAAERLWSVRHAERTPYAFEVELEHDGARVWLSSTDDLIVAIDWAQRPQPRRSAMDALFDACERVDETGGGLVAFGGDLADELGDLEAEKVREAFRRGVSRSICSTLSRMAALGGVLETVARDIERDAQAVLVDDVDSPASHSELEGEHFEPTPPPCLPAELLELAPSDQSVYELMVEGTLPSQGLSSSKGAGPLQAWQRSREAVFATYGKAGSSRYVGQAGTYEVARYADGRRCVVEVQAFHRFFQGSGSLPYLVDCIEREARHAVSAVADLEEALASFTALPPTVRAAHAAMIPGARAAALEALLEVAPRLLDETASERRRGEVDLTA